MGSNPHTKPGGFLCLALAMQKVFNTLGTLGFVFSTGILVGGAVLFNRAPSIINGYMENILSDVTGKVTEMLPGQVDEMMPELPTSTGPAVPFKLP